jgi:hypothetical protein
LSDAISKVQIKRSLANSVVEELSPGELAFTANGDTLHIGSPNGAVIPIAGFRTPGILTANQALVSNSTSGIDKVIVANLVATSIYANNTSGSNGQILHTDGSSLYWDTVDSGVTSITAGSGLSGGGQGNVTISVNAANGLIANATGLYVQANLGIRANSLGVFAVANNGITVSIEGITVRANNGLIVNTTGLFVHGGNGVFVNSSGVHIGQDVSPTSNVIFESIISNTVFINTPLSTNSGGTGVSVYSNGDLLVGSNTTVAILPLGSSGQLLQSNGSTVVYSGIDCGEF